jgi:hypothetical protein
MTGSGATRHGSKGWSIAIRADDRTARRGPPGPSSPEEQRVLCLDDGLPLTQEIAGHQGLMTTQRYMHLSPSAVEERDRLLEQPGPPEGGHYGEENQTAPTASAA